MKRAILRMILYKIIMYFNICFFSIVVICIDYSKWLGKNLLRCQYSVSCSPWFGTPCRNFKTIRKICKILIYIFHFNLIADTITDYRTEFFFNIFSDNKYNLVKSCFFCIINRIIHDDLSIWRHLCKLFDTCSKS